MAVEAGRVGLGLGELGVRGALHLDQGIVVTSHGIAATARPKMPFNRCGAQGMIVFCEMAKPVRLSLPLMNASASDLPPRSSGSHRCKSAKIGTFCLHFRLPVLALSSATTEASGPNENYRARRRTQGFGPAMKLQKQKRINLYSVKAAFAHRTAHPEQSHRDGLFCSVAEIERDLNSPHTNE
jgi:hypothetical protein